MIAIAYGTSVAAASQKGCNTVYGCTGDIAHRPSWPSPVVCEAQQDDARRDRRQADNFRSPVPATCGTTELEAERPQGQIDIVIGLHLEAHRTTEQDVELVEVVDDRLRRPSLVWCGWLSRAMAIGRYLALHGFLLALDELQVALVIPQQVRMAEISGPLHSIWFPRRRGGAAAPGCASRV